MTISSVAALRRRCRLFLGIKLEVWAIYASLIGGVVAILSLPQTLKYLSDLFGWRVFRASKAPAPMPRHLEATTQSEPHRELSAAMRVVRAQRIRNRQFERPLRELFERYGRHAIEQLANENNADALFLLAMELVPSADERTAPLAISYFERAVEQGDADSMVYLAAAYDGEYLEKNDARALALLRKAEQLGHPEAFIALASAYEVGSYGLPKDRARAIGLYEAAIAKGSAYAEYLLALFLSRSIEDADRIRAGELFKDASAKGVIAAKLELAFTTMSEGQPIEHFLFRSLGPSDTRKLSAKGRELMAEIVADSGADRHEREMAEKWA